MNWLLYLSGWFWGLVITSSLCVNFYDNDDKIINRTFYIVFIFWTMLWIWICWRFVK